MWIASATPETERMRWRASVRKHKKNASVAHHGRRRGFWAHLGRPREHDLARVQTRARSVLDLLDLGAALANAGIQSVVPSASTPPATHTLPMRELGMINLMVTAREPGTDATSNGSSLMRRTMRPNACAGQTGPLRLSSHLADSVERAKHVQYPLGIAGNGLGDGDAGSRLFLRA